ncbi:MAG: dihydropteroate synthase [Muribaculaceae bacterium]|nr:dihydropteroate synthase [Muribaculaceae bacterium]
MTICIDGKIRTLSPAWVMGIINATPDSFYAGSRTPGKDGVAQRARRLIDLGADCLDIGGYSSRPGASHIPADEEYSRLAMALEQVRRIDESAVISVDTFRADVARRCVEEWNVAIINDISGGTLDPEMPATVASLGVAYVLMHMRGNPVTMNTLTDYTDVTAEVISDLAFKVARLRQEGVADIIVDPGFGFAKTVEQNFTLLRNLRDFAMLGCPVLAGLSRKSMIWRTLGLTPEESLNGTTALHMAALAGGASILRVHDVAEARQCVALHSALR